MSGKPVELPMGAEPVRLWAEPANGLDDEGDPEWWEDWANADHCREPSVGEVIEWLRARPEVQTSQFTRYGDTEYWAFKIESPVLDDTHR